MKMEIDNLEFGGFIVSKNVLEGRPIRYSFREHSSIKECNGWTIYSAVDDEDYVSNGENFEIISAETMAQIAPIMLTIFTAPYGTDLLWRYEKGVLAGFYDLKNNKETTIKEILDIK